MLRALCAGAVLCVALAASLAVGAADSPCLRVEAGEDLQARIDAAPEGARLCLASGMHRGPVHVGRRIRLEGPADAVIRARGHGTTVQLEAAGAALYGVTVDGSGGRHDLLDAAVRVRGDDVVVQGVTVRNALFGVLVEKSRRVSLRDNTILGSPDKTLGMRGDGIRIWEVRDSTIQGNRLLDSRDLVVWYSPGNRIERNVVERGRYGTHFMYSHDNVVEDNRYVGNVVGVFVMYSRDLRIRRNLFARSTGSAGVGLGAKESGPLEVSDNVFVANTVGAYLDTSPLDLTDHNSFRRNDFRLNETAVIFHSTVERNSFIDNRFRDNQMQIRVEGRGDALASIWRRNDFDDYTGYDLDGDGFGDVPYELRSLSEQLIGRHPQLAFFRGSPAMSIVEIIGRVIPLFRTRVLLVDPEPRMRWQAPEAQIAG